MQGGPTRAVGVGSHVPCFPITPTSQCHVQCAVSSERRPGISQTPSAAKRENGAADCFRCMVQPFTSRGRCEYARSFLPPTCTCQREFDGFRGYCYYPVYIAVLNYVALRATDLLLQELQELQESSPHPEHHQEYIHSYRAQMVILAECSR